MRMIFWQNKHHFSLAAQCFSLLFVSVFFCSTNSFGKGDGESISLVESSILCAVSGYAYHRPEDSLDRQKELATQAASYLAVKKATSLISKLSEFVPDSQGNVFRIDSLKVLPPAIGGENLVGVVAFGELVYRQFASSVPATSSEFSVRLRSNKKQFTEGDSIVLTLSGSQDFYGAILNQSSGGEVLQLLPNEGRRRMYFKADRNYNFPDPLEGDDFHLEVSPPFGRELIWLVASDKPFSVLSSSDAYEFFAISQKSFTDIKSGFKNHILRTMGNSTKTENFLHSQFLVYGVSLETRPR